MVIHPTKVLSMIIQELTADDFLYHVDQYIVHLQYYQ